MDAPPAQEDSRPFIDVAGRLQSAGLNAPEILHFDIANGFGILEDFGDRLYRDVIDPATAADVLPNLFDVLVRMARDVDPDGLPPYDPAFLQTELDLFTDWYLARHRNRPFSAAEQSVWRNVCALLIESAQDQPQVFVHRDFHSCNLMWRDGGPPGIIDFQDAMHGPLSYDFISLAWDRYIRWPREQLERWMADICPRIVPGLELEDWIIRCDLMGLQRNLKIVGIFARLRYRDGKRGYVEMIPTFYQYLLDVLPRYPELGDFLEILEDPSCAP